VTIHTVSALPTRFEAAVVPNNVLTQLEAVSEDTKHWIRRVAQDYQIRRLGYHGDVPDEAQFSGELSFSDDDGQTFVNPLPTPDGNRVCYIRVKITQHASRARLSGLRLDWYLPAGWTWRDGLGTTTYEEMVSNPTEITRAMLSPANPQPAKWTVLVGERFY
jgi:hypothetical protein